MVAQAGFRRGSISSSVCDVSSGEECSTSSSSKPMGMVFRHWERVHLDFAGPFQESMLLIAVDAHSKWPEVHVLLNTRVPRTLDSLR